MHSSQKGGAGELYKQQHCIFSDSFFLAFNTNGNGMRQKIDCGIYHFNLKYFLCCLKGEKKHRMQIQEFACPICHTQIQHTSCDTQIASDAKLEWNSQNPFTNLFSPNAFFRCLHFEKIRLLGELVGAELFFAAFYFW